MNLPNDEVGTIARDVAARLIMVEPGAFDQLVREGWFKPVSRLRFNLVEVVQGYLKSLRHEIERGRTASEAAAHVDLGVGRFTQLVETNVIPRQKTRSYRLDDVRRVYIRHLRAIAAGQGSDGGTTLANERAALAREQTLTAQIKNAAARGDLVSLTAVQKRLIALLAIFRERILSIPGKMADPLSMRTREEIEPLLRDELYEALDELSDPTLPAGSPVVVGNGSLAATAGS